MRPLELGLQGMTKSSPFPTAQLPPNTVQQGPSGERGSPSLLILAALFGGARSISSQGAYPECNMRLPCLPHRMEQFSL